MRRNNTFRFKLVTLLLMCTWGVSVAQSEMDHVDLTSVEMTTAEMSRDELLALIANRMPGVSVDLSKRRLSGLDLSGVDLSGTDLRWARLNRTDLRGANLRGARLDNAWMIEANLEGADLTNASLFASQMQRARLVGATLRNARIIANLSRAEASGANFDGADMAADMRNQSMGLMRTVLRSATADGASFRGTKAGRIDAEFASLRDADLTRADFTGAKLAGADLTGANVHGMVITGADVNSTKLVSIKGHNAMVGFEQARNVGEAFR